MYISHDGFIQSHGIFSHYRHLGVLHGVVFRAVLVLHRPGSTGNIRRIVVVLSVEFHHQDVFE